MGFGLALAALAMLVGCAGSGSRESDQPAAGGPPSTGNPELDRLLAVEVDVAKQAPQALPDALPYRGSLPLAYEYTAEEGVDRFEMRIDEAGNVLTCYVYPEEIEYGASAVRLATMGGKTLEEHAGPFPHRAVSNLFAGSSGRHAYHGMASLWRGDRGFAQPKAVAGNAAGLGAACVHLGLGHRQTMIDTLTHLLASLERAEPVPEPYFEEVMLSELDGLHVGVARLRMYFDAEGDTEIRLEDSTLMPSAPDAVHVDFGFTRSWSRPDGALINAYTYHADQEQMVTELNLRPDDGAWRVTGKFQGKEIDAVLEHRDAIDSSRAEYLALARVLRPHGDAASVTLHQWISAADPTHATETKATVDPEQPDGIAISVGPILMQGERGPEGLVDRATVPIGDRKVSMKVLYRAGEL